MSQWHAWSAVQSYRSDISANNKPQHDLLLLPLHNLPAAAAAGTAVPNDIGAGAASDAAAAAAGTTPPNSWLCCNVWLKVNLNP
jgi:hypothetical protein